MSYLTYSEYQSYGGTLNVTAFSSYLYDVESKLNYLTNNRIGKLDTIPEVVKRLEYKLIGIYASLNNNETANLNQFNPISSYSNGIESVSYSVNSNNSVGSTSIDNQIYSVVKEYLSEYPELLYRGKAQWKRG